MGLLTHKIKEKGITGKLGIWLNKFLTNRTQKVIANNEQSSSSSVLSSVPQGSVLGPILFLIMIDSISNSGISSWLSLFADDTRAGNVVSNQEDAAAIQADLEIIYDWTSRNNMELNGTKFESIKYGRNTELKNEYDYITPGYNSPITQKNSVKDLGIMMSDSGDFQEHIAVTIGKVRNTMNWIRRSFASRDHRLMKTLWQMYCQTVIDYGSQLWFPTDSGQLGNLEALLRTYSSWFSGVSEMNYWQRLSFLKFNSIQRRSERYRIIYIWKILEGKVPNPNIVWNIEDKSGRLCSIRSLPPGYRNPYINLRDSTFQIVGPRLFNSLPGHIRNLTGCSVDVFKIHLDGFLMDLPDTPKVDGLTPEPCNLFTGRPSNSIIDWINHLKLNNRRPSLNHSVLNNSIHNQSSC